MLRPSASSTYSSAVSAIRTQKLLKYCSTSGSASSSAQPTAHATALFWRLMKSIMPRFPSRAVRDPFAEQARGPQRQHHDQHDEREDVGVLAAQHAAGRDADIAGADRLDEAEQDAAHHRA